MPAKSKKRGPNAAAREVSRRRRRRRGRRGLHYALLIIFVISVGALLCLTVLFEIEEIIVTGSDRYPADEIIAVSGVHAGQNLFRVPTGEIERDLANRYPYIENVRLHRLFPPSIEIRIEESVPCAALLTEDELVLITSAGKVLERGLILISPELLLVYGIDVEDLEPGDYLGHMALEPRPPGEVPFQAELRESRNDRIRAKAQHEADGLRMINYLQSAMEETGFTGLTNLDVTDPFNMKVMFENRLLLLLGTEANLPDKLLLIRLVVEERLDPQAHGTLDAADIATKDWVVYTPDSGYNSDGSPIGQYNPEEPENGA
ncbi:MAG: FtsQ-type POTRA domain-containing protein [Oscillospiraceae bacterium]|nr:FtsQ-type POTRA domain-containing protein [Oscillospiraceae bacterium]